MHNGNGKTKKKKALRVLLFYPKAEHIIPLDHDGTMSYAATVLGGLGVF